MTFEPKSMLRERSDVLEIAESQPAPAAPRSLLAGLDYEAGAALLSPRSTDETPAPASAQERFKEKLATWSRTPPKHNYRRVRFRGVMVSVRTRQLLRRAEAIMRKRFDQPEFTFKLTQGSYSQGVAASAGTHDGGGAVDIHTRSYPRHVVNKMVRALRMAGFAAWSRGRGADSMSPHIHAVAVGDKEATPIAKAQLVDFARGRNGLRGHAADPDADLKAPRPRWARRKLAKIS